MMPGCYGIIGGGELREAIQGEGLYGVHVELQGRDRAVSQNSTPIYRPCRVVDSRSCFPSGVAIHTNRDGTFLGCAARYQVLLYQVPSHPSLSIASRATV